MKKFIEKHGKASKQVKFVQLKYEQFIKTL